MTAGDHISDVMPEPRRGDLDQRTGCRSNVKNIVIRAEGERSAVYADLHNLSLRILRLRQGLSQGDEPL